MKKKVLLAMALMMSVSGFAQTTIWDGEDKEINTQGGFWDDGSPVVVENPEKDGINTSEKCLKFTMTETAKVVKLQFATKDSESKPSMDGSYRVSLMIKKTVNENVKIEFSDPTDGSDGYWEKVAAWYGGAGKWQKVVFDFSINSKFDYPGVISITAQTTTVENSQDVYIDNVVIEPATKVNDKLLSEIGDGTLTGNLTLTGAWMKGDCSKVTDTEWTTNNYNDFATLAAKLSKDVTSIDMRGAVLKDAYNAFLDANPNIVVFSDVYFEGDNVVVTSTEEGIDDKATKLVLDPTYPFGIIGGFVAETVELRRELKAGLNTLYLPFFVSATDLGAENIATYSGSALSDNVQNVTFKIVDGVEANTPILVKVAETAVTVDDADETETKTLTFTNKYVKELDSDENKGNFYGVYVPQSAKDLWGIGDNGFIKGGENAKLNAFSAYLKFAEDANDAKSVVISFNDATGISNVAANSASETVDVYSLSGMRVLSGVKATDAMRNLAKGLYIINGKKVVVK